MSKEELEINSKKIENNPDEAEVTKRLCVHELTRTLKKKQKKENILKVIILLIMTFLIFFLSVIIY
ncbi:hypothetical protein N9T58_00745 [bacterium]|nr:hypothetical protein [bacterium]